MREIYRLFQLSGMYVFGKYRQSRARRTYGEITGRIRRERMSRRWNHCGKNGAFLTVSRLIALPGSEMDRKNRKPQN